MPFPVKATDGQIAEAYQRTGSIWKAARELGMCGQSVQERLVKLGIDRSKAPLTGAEVARLKAEYLLYRDAGRVSDLATAMGRAKTFLCTQARKLGLTDKRTPKLWSGKWKYMTEDAARLLFEKFKGSRLGAGQFCQRFQFEVDAFSRTMRRFFPDEWEHVIEAKVPSQSMYGLGRALEYRVRDYLRERGYFVLRSPRSGSAVDLVAIRRGRILFIQCKRSGQLHTKEWNDVFDLAGSVGALPVMASARLPHGIDFFLLTARKDGSKRRQPMAPLMIEREGAA